MVFKVETIETLGTVQRQKDKIIIEIVRYGDKDPMINVQTIYTDRDSGEEKRGKRPAYDLSTISKILPLLEAGKGKLEELKNDN